MADVMQQAAQKVAVMQQVVDTAKLRLKEEIQLTSSLQVACRLWLKLTPLCCCTVLHTPSDVCRKSPLRSSERYHA